ncbi:MAG: alkaline phosphatase family protein [Planctomycetota bacterium]
MQDAAPPGPVLVVGIDGLEPSVVAAMLAEGELPNLARFANEGALGQIETLEPSYSPVIWTTVATGLPMADHGIDWFLESQTGLPYTSEARRVPALWNLVSEAGLSVDVVGWWVTWPAERIRGRMLASYAAQAQAQLIWKTSYFDVIEEMTWPTELIDEVYPQMLMASEPAQVRAATEERFPRPPALPEDPADVPRMVTDLAWTLAADRTNAAVGEQFLRSDPGDLVMVYLALPDVAGHRFWRYHEPEAYPYEVNPASIEALGDFVRLAHRDADASLGRLLDEVDGEWTVVVLSDHGMHVDRETLDDPAHIGSGHHRDAAPGIIGVGGPGSAPPGPPRDQAPIAHVYDVAPFVLRRLGLPRPSHWPAVRGDSRLAELLDPEWAAAHPARTCGPPERDWLAANPRRLPRAPDDTSNQVMMESLEALGYLPEDDAEQP